MKRLKDRSLRLAIGLGKKARRFFYPSFCAVCHSFLDEEKRLCTACLAQVELCCGFSACIAKPEDEIGKQAAVFEKTQVSSALVEKVKKPSGYFLSKAIASYAALRLLDLKWDVKAVYVEKGLEGVGCALGKVLGASYRGRARAKLKSVFVKPDLKDFEGALLLANQNGEKRGYTQKGITQEKSQAVCPYYTLFLIDS